MQFFRRTGFKRVSGVSAGALFAAGGEQDTAEVIQFGKA